MKKSVKPQKKEQPSIRIENCHIENGTMPEGAADAITALANAAQSNANAIAEIARCFRPGPAEMKYGIAIFGGQEE